jgi:hypothetical protein
MAQSIDPHAFRIAMELASQLSSDGTFVDEPSDAQATDGDFVCIGSSKNAIEDVPPTSTWTDPGLLSVQSLPDTPTGTDALYELDPRDCLSWWSTVDEMAGSTLEEFAAVDGGIQTNDGYCWVERRRA